MTALYIQNGETEYMSDEEFFVRVFGRKPGERNPEQDERDQAWKECEAEMAKAPKGRDHYWRRKQYLDACSARYAARINQIHEKYHPVALTEVSGDPFLKARAA